MSADSPIEADLASVLRAIGRGELADGLNDRGELLVVVTDTGIQFGQLFLQCLVIAEEFAHPNEGTHHTKRGSAEMVMP